jgi:hypothetical protein
LGGGEIAQRQGVLQDKEMRRTPGAGQGAGDLVALLLAAGIPQGHQGVRVALARANGADDTWPRGARHSAACWRSLQVHRPEGLLPLEDMGGTMLQKLGTRA